MVTIFIKPEHTLSPQRLNTLGITTAQVYLRIQCEPSPKEQVHLWIFFTFFKHLIVTRLECHYCEIFIGQHCDHTYLAQLLQHPNDTPTPPLNETTTTVPR
mmetsp:Transcript_31692/g.42229  ORF Transcript_31692/g.42229 Transcript_31692/m.42229 type:complete len:101 (+) Transcript_31692:805-1107(+)